MEPSDAILRFLASVGRPGEAEFYLNLFRSETPDRFAIIAPDDEVRRDATEALDVDLHFLQRLGLEPVLAGPDDDLAALAATHRVRKVVFLGARRGLAPSHRPVPSIVDLTTEYDELMVPNVLSDDQRALLSEARRIIDAVQYPLTVAVTSPLDLLRELFTVRGAGTMIRRGAVVTRHESLDAVDRPRLVALIESAFGAPPADAVFERTVAAVYIAGDYRGASVVEPSPVGSYLGKFAVDRRARGEGIGRDLWRAMAADHAALYWRSRPDNPIAPWYADQCDGMVRTAAWHVYWRGLAPAQIPQAIEQATAAPVDFPRT